MNKVHLLKHIDHLEKKLGKRANPVSYGLAKEGFFDTILGKKNPTQNEVKNYEKEQFKDVDETIETAYQKLEQIDLSAVSGEIEVKGILSLFRTSEELASAVMNLGNFVHRMPEAAKGFAASLKATADIVVVDKDNVDLIKINEALRRLRSSEKPIQIQNWKVMKTSGEGKSDEHVSYVDNTGVFFARTTIRVSAPDTLLQLATVPAIVGFGTNITYHTRSGKIKCGANLDKIKNDLVKVLKDLRLVDNVFNDLEEDHILPITWRADGAYRDFSDKHEWTALCNMIYSLADGPGTTLSELLHELSHIAISLSHGLSGLK